MLRQSSVSDQMEESHKLFNDLIEKELENVIASQEIVEPLASALRYAVFPGGKRIRPLLTVLFARDLGGDPYQLLPVAISLELIHCASLIHDDLPALDNDAFRRGQPSCHRAFGEASAVLAGDLLVPLAFSSVARSVYPAAIKAQMIEVLAEGYIAVCNGQQLDLLPRKVDLSSLHRLKTGALFKVGFSFAALACELKTHALKIAADAGVALGECFQISDDYIDVFGSEELRGRPESSDSRNKRHTYFTYNDKTDGLRALAESQAYLESRLLELEICILGSAGSCKRTRDTLASIFRRLESI